MYKNIITGIFVGIAATMVTAAAAEVPHLLPVVGVISDAGDTPLEGEHDVVFSLYDGEEELAAVWSESYTGEDALFFEDGLFRAYLGSQNSLDTYIVHFLDNDELWLGMKIDSDVEMTRVRLAAVPWGIEAEYCSQIGDYEADDLQPAIGAAACDGNEFLQGWDPVGGAVCNEMSVPAEYLTETEGGALFVPLPTSDLSTCEFGLAWDGTGGVLDCMDEADVESRCYTSHGGDAYLGSDGACHNAPHMCSAEQYMDGDETCQDGPQVCTANQYMDGNGNCQEAPHKCSEGQVVDGAGNCHTVVPVGGIIMWSGDIGSIPAGWALCDGNNGTPNLKDRFIVGAGDAYAVGDDGGEASVTLTTDQIPSHNHTVNDPGHFHSYSYAYEDLDDQYEHGNDERPVDNVFHSTQNTGTSYTGIYLSDTGGGLSHENRPPYYALAYIMRVSS